MKPTKSIARVELEARALGLSYGEYLAGRAPRRQPEGTEERRELPPIGENTEDQAKTSHAGGRPAVSVNAIDRETGEILASYNTLTDAGKARGISVSAIYKAVKSYARGDAPPRSAAGLYWRRA